MSGSETDSTESNGLDGKVAVVTGGAAGIGRATALAFAQRGAKVVVADVDDSRGDEVVAAIEAAGGEATYVHTDVSVDRQVADMVDTAIQTYGRLDAAFNNAGIEGSPATIDQLAREQWDRLLAVNLTGVYRCMAEELPHLTDGGAIVNCSSVAGLVGIPASAGYVATKHAVIGLTRSAALEVAPRGIRVNAVCPGVIDTEMVARATANQPELVQGVLAAHPLGRMGRADEVAETVVWLCSSAASFVTGQAIPVDGGYTSQ
ncbi:MAG: SDR family oxidoreductase [Acidimicrobiia bacterium]|nr:SDR family oxidoreductase [Acidimicrobiia bacterium]